MPSFVQSNKYSASAVSVTQAQCAFTSPNSSGNTVVVYGTVNSSSGGSGGNVPVPAGWMKQMGTGKWGAISPPYIVNTWLNYWSRVRPEGMWWDSDKGGGAYDWTLSDQAESFCAAHPGVSWREMSLVWLGYGSGATAGLPGWASAYTAAQIKTRWQNWVTAFGNRYKNSSHLVEVVVCNEPLGQSHNNNFTTAFGGAGSSGWDWLLNIFAYARAAIPGIRLAISDYNVESTQWESAGVTAYANICQMLKNAGTLDIIDMEAAWLEGKTPSEIATTLTTSYHPIGLPIQFTEMEFPGNDATQLSYFQSWFPVLWNHPDMMALDCWGWLDDPNDPTNPNGTVSGYANGYLYSSVNSTPRPAITWLKNYITNNPLLYTGNASSGSNLSISDSQGNSYQSVISSVQKGSGILNFVYVAFGVRSGANTVTIQYGGTVTKLSIDILEYSGLQSNSIDVAAATQGIGSIFDSLPITPQTSGELVLAFASNDQGSIVTPASAWTKRVTSGLQDGVADAVSPVTVAALSESASYTAIPPAGQIFDASLNQWTISAGVVLINGSPAATSSGVVQLAYVNHVVWQENGSGAWWSWTGTSWQSGIGPLIESPNMTIVPSGASQIIDAAGNTWTLST